MNPTRAKALMVLGTGSGVGKSFVTAGLCRVLSDAGIRVAPFKAQNMSNNSWVTREGGEMARAQVVQAECARIEPTADMNPILLKPAADNHSQVVLQGQVMGKLTAREYYGLREKMGTAIQESYERLAREFDVLIIEGAGSPAEINLKDYDRANFRVAEMADASCLLVGDIDRGGVFAWLWGTLALLDESERDRITGFVINKFRGDFKLLEPGLRMLEGLSGKKVWGTLPYATDIWMEEEDAVFLPASSPGSSSSSLEIAVICFPRISNATDFQILAAERAVSIRWVKRSGELGSPDLLILPGTKATAADLQYLRESGLAKKIQDYAREGGRILGICGGFQMLGEMIEDPDGIESGKRFFPGLGLLPLRTRFFPGKTLRRVQGRVRTDIFSHPVQGKIGGYEIHMGQSDVREGLKPLLEIGEEGSGGPWRAEGAIDPSGRIFGTYLHGLFDETGFRTSFLEALRKSSGKTAIGAGEPLPSSTLVKENNYDKLAFLLKKHLNLKFLDPICSKSLLPSV